MSTKKFLPTLSFIVLTLASATHIKCIDDSSKYPDLVNHSPELIQNLSLENFDSEIDLGRSSTWIVFFGTPWCTYCQNFAPIYKKFATQA
jgi:thiol-disulfide isomerase/thioredoxin